MGRSLAGRRPGRLFSGAHSQAQRPRSNLFCGARGRPWPPPEPHAMTLRLCGWCLGLLIRIRGAPPPIQHPLSLHSSLEQISSVILGFVIQHTEQRLLSAGSVWLRSSTASGLTQPPLQNTRCFRPVLLSSEAAAGIPRPWKGSFHLVLRENTAPLASSGRGLGSCLFLVWISRRQAPPSSLGDCLCCAHGACVPVETQTSRPLSK